MHSGNLRENFQRFDDSKIQRKKEEFKFRGWFDAAFRLGQETHQILSEFQQTR